MTKTEEKAAWLAEHVMGFRNKEMGIGVGIRWWVDTHSSGEDRPRYPVAKWMRHPDMPYWNPFEDIRQAKEVQAEMCELGWHWVAQGCVNTTAFTFLRADPFGSGDAIRDTEAAAICEAAGRALGWPFEEDA